MLELDTFLVPFTLNVYADLSKAEQENYRNLLQHEDPSLFAWLMRHERPKSRDIAAMVEKVIEYAREGHRHSQRM